MFCLLLLSHEIADLRVQILVSPIVNPVFLSRSKFTQLYLDPLLVLMMLSVVSLYIVDECVCRSTSSMW